MCGIAGFYNLPVSRNQPDSLMDRLKHRGPDDQRFYINGDVGLVHTRLSIIDLSDGGAQPYRFGNLVVVFNGELYNYKEIRETLKHRGYSFQSESDTEVLLKAFHYWRESCVDHFIGMFAFAIYDETHDAIWLFRDRLGVKPLYYSHNNGVLLFASELKALLVFDIRREIDDKALFYYFRFGFVPGPCSIFRSVSKVEAGHWIKIDRSGLTKRKYWEPSSIADYSRTEDQWLDQLEETLISAFRYRMVSDVPVGVFLSGGIDSSLLAAILKNHYGDIRSFTIGFKEQHFDESPYARSVAKFLDISHTEKMLTLSEAKRILNDFYSIYDEPFADTSGIPMACVTQLAKENGVKVVLSADGGDELFGGYQHYRRALNIQRRVLAIPKSVRTLAGRLSSSLMPRNVRASVVAANAEHRMYALEELLSSDTSGDIFEALVANQSVDEVRHLTGYPGTAPGLFPYSKDGDPLRQMMAWDLNNFLVDDLLVKVDRATMYYGIECREPFLDHRLVELSMRIPSDLIIRNGKEKYLVRKLLNRYVPEALFDRRKQGFSIPVFEWFRADLDSMFNTYLDRGNIRRIGVLDALEVEKELRKYNAYKTAGKQYNIEKMWRILSFALWWEKYMDA